ncbi:hypothetical protein D3C80_1662600 [compost metagenome]
MLAGCFTKLRGFAVQVVGPQYGQGRAVAAGGGGILLVEIVVLTALDPFRWVVAVEVHAGRLRCDLNANLQTQVVHAKILRQMHGEIEQSLRSPFTDQLMEMLRVPMKHQCHSLGAGRIQSICLPHTL